MNEVVAGCGCAGWLGVVVYCKHDLCPEETDDCPAEEAMCVFEGVVKFLA